MVKNNKNNLPKNHYQCLGLMSGTSFDGLDIALCHFNYNNTGWDYEIKRCHTFKYSDFWYQRILTSKDLPFNELWKLHLDYGEFLGEKVNEFLTEKNINNNEIDFIASHGHTIFHQPDNKLTFQLGHGGAMAASVQQKVISDFRTQDLILGGQGAPLVPIGDELLFDQYDFCLNLGGIANISFTEKEIRKAFDICPVNIVLNQLAEEKGLEYDHDGKLAERGSINEDLLNKLENLSFYKIEGPRSLGKEWVADQIIPLLEEFFISTEDKLSTFTQHIAIRISDILKDKEGKILVTGGGGFNKYLLKRIKNKLPENISMVFPEEEIIKYKEAMIFGFLGLLRLLDKNNCLASVTGALRDHSAGSIYYS